MQTKDNKSNMSGILLLFALNPRIKLYIFCCLAKNQHVYNYRYC